MRLQMGVGRLMFGEGIYSNEQSLQGDGFKLVSAGNESGKYRKMVNNYG